MTLRCVTAVAIVLGAAQPAPSQQPDPRREPATAIAEMVRLLERKDHVTLLKTFARPDDLKEMLATKTIEVVAAEFAQKRAAGALEALKAASTMKPELSADGTRATYRFDKPIGGDSRVTLMKIGEYWYLR
jgi:hypothetical protein